MWQERETDRLELMVAMVHTPHNKKQAEKTQGNNRRRCAGTHAPSSECGLPVHEGQRARTLTH